MSQSNDKKQFGRVQLRIMQILWNKRAITARKITDELNELYPSEPIAHSTVQTLLRGLEEKGAVNHEAEGRTFVFYPLVAEGDFKQSAIGDLVERVFNGNVSGLMAHLLKHKKVSRKELNEIRRLIEVGGETKGRRS